MVPLTKSGRYKAPGSKLKHRIWERDDYICYLCGADLKAFKNDKGPRKKLTTDHIISRANGGSNEESNLKTCCKACNKKKNDEEDMKMFYSSRR